MVEAGSIAGGRFRLIKAIGKGGMSTVWWARHELLGRDVALKLSPAGRSEKDARFQREAQIIGRFQHRNIVSILDAGEFAEEGMHFLAMELLRGRPFSARFAPGKPQAAEEVLPILIDVCRGLEVAHAVGVVHRDIKPENIFLADVPGEGMVPKILDFGISKTPDATITADGQILGTPAYMSPEQALGARDITPAADLWAIGVILYEALAGKLPFAADDYRYLLLRIVEGTPDPLPPSVDDLTRTIVDRCLQKDPASRYPNAQRLREDLERAYEALTGVSIVEPSAPRISLTPLSHVVDPLSFMPTIQSPTTMELSPAALSARPARPASLLAYAALCLSLLGGAVLSTPTPAEPAAHLGATIGKIATERAAVVQAAAAIEQRALAMKIAEAVAAMHAATADEPRAEAPSVAPKLPASAPRRFVTRVNNPGF